MGHRSQLRIIAGTATACAAVALAAATALASGDHHRGPPAPTGKPTATAKPDTSPNSTAPPSAGAVSDGAAPVAPNPDCTLIVPANPLSAAGLATPYQLTATHARNGRCEESNAAQSAFVQAVVLNPATGAVAVYAPLVVDEGTKPAVAPVVPTLAPGTVVGIWFGYNGTNLKLAGPGSQTCTNGLGGSLFTQYAYCDAGAFVAAANTAVAVHRLVIPPLGVGADGRPCPTVRDFSVVDQDQSDNVTSTYLTTRDGRTAQNTAANLANTTALGKHAIILANGSDNRLLDAYIDPALHCAPVTAPDLADPGRNVSALALNELQAAAEQGAPVALVPSSDPMTQVDGRVSLDKTNLYRAGVGQPSLPAGTDTDQVATAYCSNLKNIAEQRFKADKPFTVKAPSPDPAEKNLFAFLNARLTASLRTLDCES